MRSRTLYGYLTREMNACGLQADPFKGKTLTQALQMISEWVQSKTGF